MNILITGASSGIGFQVTKQFLQEGHRILALADRIGNLETLRAGIADSSALSYHQFDLLEYSSAQLDEISSPYRSFDLLINNAGVVINKTFSSLTLEEWREVFEVNFFGPLQLIKDLLPKLKLGTRPHILNIGSIGGFQGSVKFAGLSAYSASKAALANLTESLAVEFEGEGISVNCLCPGSVDTQMFREAFPNQTAAVQSAEIAQFICSFALQAPGLIHGKVLPISVATP